MISTRLALEGVTLLLSIVSIIVWLIWISRHRSQALYAIPPITWSLHLALFYLATILTQQGRLLLETEFMLVWEAALRFHATFLLIGIGTVMVFNRITIRQ